MATLILRNVLRNLRRLLPMIAILALVFVVLLVGNAVLAASQDALAESYVDHVSGDMSVSAAAEGSFTIFGSEQLLVGEYLVPPTVIEYRELEPLVRELPEVEATAGLLSAVARVRIAGRTEDRTVFGVDFGEYREMFPELEIVAGEYPEPGEPGIMVQAPWDSGAIGSDALLQVARRTSFTLREVPVTGVFRYPVEDELLDRVVLVDPETARSLNGYIRGATEEQEIPEEQQELLDSEMDSLFGGGDMAAGSDGSGAGAAVGGSGTDPGVLLESLQDRREAEAARETVAGAWNFLLISLTDPGDSGRVERALADAGYNRDNGYLVRDWRRTVGGTAQLVSYLQLMFNAGLLFVAFGAAVVATNALVLSVLERTKEIGTFRALGSSRARVAAMIASETVIVVVGAAILGLLVGILATNWLNGAGVVIENRYIEILFGGGAITGSVSGGLLVGHLAAAVILAVVSLLYPLKKALSIRPVEAMAAW